MPDNHLLDLAHTAAQRAASYIRDARRPDGPDGWERKGAKDFVTEIDRTAERLIAEVLLHAEPSSHLLGEETAPDADLRGLVWIVDPLDGTTNFLHGFPHYAVSIGAAIDGVLRAGVVIHVPRGDVATAVLGHGAWLNGDRIQVSTINDPANALLGTGFPFSLAARIDEYAEQFRRVARGSAGLRRAGAAALDLVDVACGRFDAFWELRLAPWDIAAGALIVQEAGGVVTDLAGAPLQLGHTSICAGNPAMHLWLVDTLAT